MICFDAQKRKEDSSVQDLLMIRASLRYAGIIHHQKQKWAAALEQEIQFLKDNASSEYEQRYIVGRELRLEVVLFEIHQLKKRIRELLEILRKEAGRERFNEYRAEDFLDLNEEVLQYAIGGDP